MLEKLNELAEKYSDRTAYISGSDRRTYGELFARAQKIAVEISGEDKSPVGVICNKNCLSMEAIIACLLAKRAYVPISSSMPEERRRKIIESSGAGVLIDCTDNQPEINKVKNGAQTIRDNQTAYIIYTSGSTGEPKGVPISYENLENFTGWISNLEPLCGYEHAKVLNQAEFSFDLSTAAIFFSLFGGHTIVQLPQNNDFCAVYDIIEQNKTDVFVVTPTFLRICLLDKNFCSENFPFIKCIYFCGETLQKTIAKAIFERFSDIKIINAYGPTEATSAVSASEISKEMLGDEEILPCGDIEKSAVKMFIEKDEIVLKGKSVFGGYLGNIKDGSFKEGETNCYRTGDLGFIKDGKLYCKGRKDSQIKYKGYRIELSDIEANISAIPDVENCVVLAKRNTEDEVRMIKAFICGNVTEDGVRKELSKKLPEYMIPKSIKILDSLPVNENGKIDRKELEHR